MATYRSNHIERFRWTRESLQNLIAARLGNMRFIVVSNREPYLHTRTRDGIGCITPASGMATALDPIMRASGGVWIAHGSGDADRMVTDARDHVAVPPDNPRYTLRRVWLDKEIESGYYYGLSNEGLWPLCHIAFHSPVFRLGDWECYRQANQIFADAVLEEAQGEPAFVFIQDYHFGLLPRMLKNSNPSLVVAQFWHIPWPNREVFRVFPWSEELLDGMLGNDLLAFHLSYHCANFLETVGRGIEALVEAEHSDVTRGGHVTMVRPFPISIDFEAHSAAAAAPEVDREMDAWIQRIGRRPDFMGIGIDRIDYTKGIPNRLAGLDLFLEKHPEYQGRMVFVQVGVPSRMNIEQYSELDSQLAAQVDAINAKWGKDGWQPVCYHRGHCSQKQMMALHRLADFCIVSSLHDGMNLVAKEFVASRFDDQGVLILSSFAGAARELPQSTQVNPFSVDGMADAILKAILTPPEERTRSMQSLRLTVGENNVYQWAGQLLSKLLKIEPATDTRDMEELRLSAAQAS
jgi:trehalose-6-phosphate synthase